ncbi:hypothetical protein [Leptolyngbya sp. 'hensonii']|uniref:hypothetical protein n=1 Tax=Leptolyngbya sp. 'hensonii' TaxID=1922337 RepID=UPI000A58F759|nr:hypothetical protein [Leptolyngbya sp. 'hensonii']
METTRLQLLIPVEIDIQLRVEAARNRQSISQLATAAFITYLSFLEESSNKEPECDLQLLVGDYFETRSKSILKLQGFTELGDCLFLHVDSGVKLPPIPRSMAKSRLRNISDCAWDKPITDLTVEICAS